MKIFLDTIDTSCISDFSKTGAVDGITTNPALLSSSTRPYRELLSEICSLVSGEVSVEVISTDAEDIVEEGLKLSKISNNVVVKLPMTYGGICACTTLTRKHGIRVNVTLCFTVAQALLAAKAGAYFVSPFVGRLDDLGGDGLGLIRDIRTVYSNYGFSTKILAASIRGTQHVVEVAKAGADIATVPVKVFKQLFFHPMTDLGIGGLGNVDILVFFVSMLSLCSFRSLPEEGTCCFKSRTVFFY